MELTGPDGPIRITSSRQRVVLAALAMTPGEAVSVDRLADFVWHDQPPPSSGKVIQNLVLMLRKVLGNDTIATRPPGYVLCVDRDAIDVHRFDRLWREGRVAAASGRHERAAALFDEANRLWRGAPLADLVDDVTARAEAERLGEQFRDLADERADVALALGRHHDCRPSLEAMVRQEPLRERRWGMLMVALHGCGRHADALRAFQRAREALAEVGLEPGPGLCALERRVAANDQSLPAAQATPSTRGNLARPPTSWIGPKDRL